MGELKPFFQLETSGRGRGTRHDISSLTLTDPKVSSIEGQVSELDQWESSWVGWHSNLATAQYVTYGALNDKGGPYANEAQEDGSWEEDLDTEFLIRCSGEDRPIGRRDFKRKVTPSADNNFAILMTIFECHNLFDSHCGILCAGLLAPLRLRCR